MWQVLLHLRSLGFSLPPLQPVRWERPEWCPNYGKFFINGIGCQFADSLHCVVFMNLLFACLYYPGAGGLSYPVMNLIIFHYYYFLLFYYFFFFSGWRFPENGVLSGPGEKGFSLGMEEQRAAAPIICVGASGSQLFSGKRPPFNFASARVITTHIIHSLKNSPRNSLLFFLFFPSLGFSSSIFAFIAPFPPGRNPASTVKPTPSSVNTNTETVR